MAGYKKTVWQTGDVITADKMNNIEEGIDAISGADSPNTKDIRDYIDTSMSQKGQKHITLRPDDFSELYADGKVLTPGSDDSIAVETMNSAWKIYEYGLGRAFVLRADQVVKNDSAAGCVPIAFRYKGVNYAVDYNRTGQYYMADTVLVSYNATNEAYAIEEFSFTETIRQEFSDSIICRDHAGEFDSLVVFGDSIFANTISNPDTGALTNNGNGVTKQLADLMGVPLYKHAVNNATLSTKYTAESQNVVKQIQDYIASPDGGTTPLFVIEGGTNDAYHYGVSNLGTYGSSDTTTIYGAIYYAINLLLSIDGVQPWQILVCTPIPKGIRALWDGTTSFSSAGWLANTDLELTTIGHAMYEIALNRQCSVINGYNAIFDELSSSYICQLMMGDDSHPTVYGSERYARYIYDTLFSGASTKEVEEDIAELKSAVQRKADDIGSYNRFDPSTVVDGTISKAGAISPTSDWKVSDYIPVEPGMILYAVGNSASSFAMYTFEREIVQNSNNWTNPFTVPSNVYYLRLSFYVTYVGTPAAYLSTQNKYDEFKRLMPYVNNNVDDLYTQNRNAVKKDVSFSVSGLINKDFGTIIANSNYACTPLIPLTGIITKLQYTLKTYNNIAICAFYREDGAFISSVVSESASVVEVSGTVKTYPENAAYIRFCSNIQSNYVPFIGAAELGDIALMGKAVGRENVSFTEHDPVTNLIDTQLCTLGYVNGSTDGSIHSSTTFYVTSFIPLTAGKQYYFNYNYLYRGYYAFYDANKVYISGGGSASSDFIYPPFTPPAGTAYGRFTIVSQAALINAWLCETNQMAEKPADYAEQIQTKFISEKPTDYNGEDIGIFTKILCIGDSLTDGFFNESGGSRLIMRNRSYPAKLQGMTGVECTNMGYAGYTSEQWYEEYKNTDLSGHDACIIQLGVNDALNNVSESDMDAALTNIINKVKNENKDIKIFVATIIPANGYMLTSMRTRSQMIRDFVSALSDSDVYLVDLWEYGHTDDFLAYDAGHLSAYGYWRLAKDYKAYISYVIHNHPNDFRYVQFIGTNYTYSGDSSTRQISY